MNKSKLFQLLIGLFLMIGNVNANNNDNGRDIPLDQNGENKTNINDKSLTLVPFYAYYQVGVHEPLDSFIAF